MSTFRTPTNGNRTAAPETPRFMQGKAPEAEGIRRLPRSLPQPRQKRDSLPVGGTLRGADDPLTQAEEPFELERGLERLIEEGLCRPADDKKPDSGKKRGSVPPEKPLFEPSDPLEVLFDNVHDALMLELDLSEPGPVESGDIGALAEAGIPGARKAKKPE